MKYNIKKLLCILCTLIVCFISTIRIVNAAELFTEIFTTPEIKSHFKVMSTNGRSAFFRDGIVTTAYENNEVVLYYYDKSGKLIKKSELPEAKLLYYMEENDGYLYIMAAVSIKNSNGYYSDKTYLYKLDNDLKVLGRIELRSANYANTVRFEGFHGDDFIEFTEDNILICTIISTDQKVNIVDYLTVNIVDYNLTKVQQPPKEEVNEYLNRYFSDLTVNGSADKISVNINTIQNEVYSTYIDFGSGAQILVRKFLNDGTVQSSNLIINKDYNIFYGSKIIGNYIVTIGGKTPVEITKGISYIGDILIYDLEGNYLQKIKVDKHINYLNVNEDSFVIGTQVYDGICDNDKYYSNDGCDILTNIEVYSLDITLEDPIEEIPEEPKENEETKNKDEINNPETSKFLANNPSIVYLLILGIGSIIIGYKSYNKIKSLK